MLPNRVISLIVSYIYLNIGYINSFSLLEGNVTIAGIFEIQSVENSECGDVDVPSVMVMEAMKWYLTSVTVRVMELPFRIGLSGYKTCGNTGLAGKHAVDILSSYRRARTTDSAEDFIVGVLGPKYSSEAKVVSSILGSQVPADRLLQLGYSSTSTMLNDRNKYPNYYRVIPDDGVQISTMVRLMTSLEWNRIAIVYENDTYGRLGAESLQAVGTEHHICISAMYAIKIDSSRQVDVNQIRSILDDIIVKVPSTHGVIYFGSKVVANNVLQVTNSLHVTEVPIFILSESTQLQTDIFESTSGNVLAKTKGTLAVSAPYSDVSGFRDYWNSLFMDLNTLRNAAINNPYLLDVFAVYSGCYDVTLSTCMPLTDTEINERSSPLPVYVTYAIFATHTMVEALKEVSNTICGGKCTSLNQFKENFQPFQTLQAMEDLSVSYNGLAVSFRKNSPNAQLGANEKAYEVYNFRQAPDNGHFKFVNVGYLRNGDLVLETNSIKDYDSEGSELSYPDVRRGQCPVGQRCMECMYSDLAEVDFHIPGDFYVVGILSINNRALPGPIGCGTVKPRHGYQLFLSLKFGLEEFKTRKWHNIYNRKFTDNSITIGLIAINSCNNALEIVRKILNLHSNGIRLPNGDYLDLTDRIIGYVGGQSTDVSEPAALQLTKLSIVQISYSSTNPILSNKDKYPYFLRIITPDNVQAKAMIEIVKELGGEYIQIAYSEGAYGEGGHDSVVAAAAEANICIAQEILVTENERYYGFYERLRRKPHAKVVLIFLRSHVVGPFMRDVNEEMRRGEFQFIGSEAWGKNGDMMEYENIKGSITVTVEMDKDTYLEEYLKDQIPDYNISNPWLEQYIQVRQDCYFDWSYDKTFSRKCTDDILPVNELDFQSDPWCIFAFNSMLSLLKGAATFYSNECGASKSKVLCEEFVQNSDDFVEVLKKVKLDIYGSGEILIYDAYGDGLMGYKIYNIKDSDDKTSRLYKQVGSYSLSSGLTFEKQSIGYPTDDPIVSACPSESACSSCQPDPPPTTAEQHSDSTIPILGVLVGALVLIIIILVAVMIFKLRTRNPTDDTYITPAHMGPYTGAEPGHMMPYPGAEPDHMMPYPGEERYSAEGFHESDDSCGIENIPEENVL